MKKDLHRFVLQDGVVTADPRQVMQGRGAYCCPDEVCLRQVL